MTSHHITIAKASFAAGLLRPDISKINREDIAKFHTLLEGAISQCSPANIQTCKHWLWEHVISSSARTNAFGKYLSSLSRHITSESGPAKLARRNGSTSVARKRMHILYLINDLLHHSKYHAVDSTLTTTSTMSIHPYLGDLFQLAASERKSKVDRRLNFLLAIWQEEKYLSQEQIRKIRKMAFESAGVGKGEEVRSANQSVSSKKEAPYLMPPTHGDPTAPYYDLPVGNMLPHIIPNSSTPIQPDQVRALQFVAGPADEGLVNALKDFLKEIDATDHCSNDADASSTPVEMDELGQVFHRNEAGDIVGDTYYGWSRSFCEKMKKRGDGIAGVARRSRSGESSRSSSRSPRKRRRYSGSASSRSRPYSRSRSQGRRPSAGRGLARDQDRRPRSRSPSYSPTLLELQNGRATYQLQPHPPQLSNPNLLGVSSNYSAFLPSPPLVGGVHSMPIPPPLPTGWTGPWPPPPPPPMPMQRRNVGHEMSFPPGGETGQRPGLRPPPTGPGGFRYQDHQGGRS